MNICKMNNLHRFLYSWAYYLAVSSDQLRNTVDFTGCIHLNPFSLPSSMLSYLHDSTFLVYSFGKRNVYYGQYKLIFTSNGRYMLNLQNGMKAFDLWANGKYDFDLIRGPIRRLNRIEPKFIPAMVGALRKISMYLDEKSSEELACIKLAENMQLSLRRCKDCSEMPDDGTCDKRGDSILTTKDGFKPIGR